MSTKKKITIGIVVLFTLIGMFFLINKLYSLKNEKINRNFSIAIHITMKEAFEPFITDFKKYIDTENIDIHMFSTESELYNLLQTAENKKLLAILTPVANEVANISKLKIQNLIAPLPEKNSRLFSFSGIQKSLLYENELNTLAITYNPYIILTHKKEIQESNYPPLLLTAEKDDHKLANYAWAKYCLNQEDALYSLSEAQSNGLIQKNPISYTTEDIYNIFKTKQCNKILIPFSFFFDLPFVETENYSIEKLSPFIGNLQGVLFPSYVSNKMKVKKSTYIKAFDFFASPDFQYEFANAQNFLPARIDSLQRTPHSDAMKSFLLKEGTFINIETQYANEDEKKELLSELKEALSTTKIN